MSKARTIVAWAGVLFAAEVLLVLSGVIGFHQVQVVENNPFSSPVTATAFDGDRLTLSDGRVIEVHESQADWLRAELDRFDGSLGIGASGDGTYVEIRIRSEVTRCGLGAPIVVVPLRRVPFPKYREACMGYGRVVSVGLDD